MPRSIDARLMSQIIFFAIVASVLVLVASLVFSIVRPNVRVWPPPQKDEPAWRVRLIVNRLSGALVSFAGAGVLGLGVLDLGSLDLQPAPRWLAGAALLVFGGAFGLWGYIQLGPKASQGALVPLETSGPYRYSRNPQYVGAVGVLLSLGLLCNSTLGLLAGAVCSIWFVTAPFAEEAWLSEHLGSRYCDYLLSAPRFLGFPRRGCG